MTSEIADVCWLTDATAIRTVPVLRFRWPPDDENRDLLLPIDFRDYPHGVDGASTWILEHVRQRLHNDRSWFPRDVVAVSVGAAIVRLSRLPQSQPGPGI